MSDVDVRQLIAQLQTTPTGEGLLGGVLVFGSSGAVRTDTAGVPRYAVNVYPSGATLILQIFDFDAQAWRSVTLS